MSVLPVSRRAFVADLVSTVAPGQVARADVTRLNVSCDPTRELYKAINAAPSLSILAEPPVVLVDGNVGAKGARKAAEAYLNHLYTPAAPAIIAKNYFRPSDPGAAVKEDLVRFPKLDRISVDDALGGCKETRATHFADGGVFDQIQRAPH